MKFKHTLVLLLITLALGTYVFFVDPKVASTDEAAVVGPYVVRLERADITALSIKNPEAKIELRKDADGHWQLEEPVKDRADAGPAGVVTRLLTTLESLRHEGVIDEKADGVDRDFAKKAGVTDANTKIKITRVAKAPVEILLGADTPAGRKVYARVEGDKYIYVVPNDLKTQISKKADAYRDPRLSALTPQTVTRIELKTPTGEMELRKSKTHLWSLAKPLTARGDESQVNDLVSRVTAARVEEFAPDASNLAAFGLAEPRATVTLFAEGAAGPEVLRIGGNPIEEKDKEMTWVQLSTRPSVMLVSKAIEQILVTQPNDLRDKHLVRIESEAKTDIIDRIIIEPAGRSKIVLARKGETWTRKAGDEEMAINDSVATRLLADFQNQKVTRFVEDVAVNLNQYGLDQPQVRVTFSSYASENTAETSAGDQPVAAVHFGKIEGDHGYARLDDEPFVVAVPKAIIESIPTDPTELQPLEIYSFRPDEIATAEITLEGQPTLSLDRETDGRWKLAKGDGNLNQTNIASFMNTLADLHAVRWVGQPKPEHSLDKPALVIVFSAVQGDRSTVGKLAVGASTPEQFWAATAEGLPGVFLISNPDRTALMLALLEKSAQPPPVPLPAASSSSPPLSTPAGTAVPPVPLPMPEAPAAREAINPAKPSEGVAPR